MNRRGYGGHSKPWDDGRSDLFGVRLARVSEKLAELARGEDREEVSARLTAAMLLVEEAATLAAGEQLEGEEDED